MSYVPWSGVLDRLVAEALCAAPPGSASNDRASIIAGAGDIRLLRDFAAGTEALRCDLGALSPEAFRSIVPGSRETPTHFKWLVYAAADESLRVWLHEYKQAGLRARGYTQAVHNHRYAFASLIVSGGYRHSRFAVPALDGGLQPPSLLRADPLRRGAVYALDPADFHAVTEVADGTVSLVIQRSADSPYSISIDLVTRRAVKHIPIEARLDMLRSVIK